MVSDDGASLPAGYETVRLNDMASSQEQLRTTMDQVKNWMDEHRPQLTQARIDDLVQGPSFDEHWSQEDDAQSKTDWENDPMKPHLLNAKNDSKLGHPWRYAARFYGMILEDIIGPRFNLRYDDRGHKTQVRVNGEQVPHPAWSAPFCESLLPVLCHDMWQDHPGTMTICLQYMVKCRTNDQRPMRWPRYNYTSDRFFDEFASVMENMPAGTSVVDAHARVRERLDGRQSLWSRVFHEIEAGNFNSRIPPKTEPPVQGDDIGEYLVTKEILDRLTKALDNQKDRHGVAVYRATEFTLKAATWKRSASELSKSSQLSTVRDSALLSTRQHEAKAAKIARLDAFPDLYLDVEIEDPLQDPDKEVAEGHDLPVTQASPNHVPVPAREIADSAPTSPAKPAAMRADEIPDSTRASPADDQSTGIPQERENDDVDMRSIADGDQDQIDLNIPISNDEHVPESLGHGSMMPYDLDEYSNMFL